MTTPVMTPLMTTDRKPYGCIKAEADHHLQLSAASGAESYHNGQLA